MFASVIRYLHGSYVPFRLHSRPQGANDAQSAYVLPPGAVLVETHLVLADGILALACYAEGDDPDYAALGEVLGGLIRDGSSAELSHEFRFVEGHLPPLGRMFGIPLVVDARVARAPLVVFRAFEDGDLVEVAWEDLARLEQPRITTFVLPRELSRHTAC